MTLSLGRELNIRSMVYIAGEPIPFFWPMRSFIHHNPLHGLEKLPFSEAVVKAQKLFHAKTYLGRNEYQGYLREGKICRDTLFASAKKFAGEMPEVQGIDLGEWFINMLTSPGDSYLTKNLQVSPKAVMQTLRGEIQETDADNTESVKHDLQKKITPDKPLYEVVDLLCGTTIGQELDELVIKSCLDFFDEGQSVWGMPSRDKGFFKAWVEMTTRNLWLSGRARFIQKIVEPEATAEGVIKAVMQKLQVPESQWMNYFTNELSRLHGWVGFIRWRENARHYYWGKQFPADLVDYLAVRLTLSLALLSEQSPHAELTSVTSVTKAIEDNTAEMYLRHELYSGSVYPPMALAVEETLAHGNRKAITELCRQYREKIMAYTAKQTALWLTEQCKRLNDTTDLKGLTELQLTNLLNAIRSFEEKESELWLLAHERASMDVLLDNVSMDAAEVREKRPFAQTLFCIDTRSERIRRHLEAMGDYQTFGIAGFFGVPFSFMELGKGSEKHLCPILLTPKNLVLEIPRDEQHMDEAAISALEKAMHELKESVLTPFVTVEAIGLLFGFDMLGKTLAPRVYNRWRKHLHHEKPVTYLLQDKLSREQADSVVRAIQRVVIENAVEHDLGLPKEKITDAMVRQIRECALEHQQDCPLFREESGISKTVAKKFIERLRGPYRVNQSATRMQLEQLGRIGFSIEEQVGFVSQALRSIGMTRQFSRFVLLVGHGSTSENNPYESALDCGACGGNHGLANARVLAQMANKPAVREKLRQQGLIIDDDVCFIPALHNTTTDELKMYDLDLLPSSHLIYIDRLRNGLGAASRLCAHERLQTLETGANGHDPAQAFVDVQRNAMDWSQVRPEWGLSRNVYFIIGQRDLTRNANLEGRSFLHSYDYREDPKRRLLENILGGPLVVGQWINMEHYFSTVDNERFGSGSKVYHNVAGRFGVMSGNLSDLRTGLPAQTVLKNGMPYHEPVRLITVIQAPFSHAHKAIESVGSVKRLVRNHWIRMLIIDPETNKVYRYEDGEWFEEVVGRSVVTKNQVEEVAQ